MFGELVRQSLDIPPPPAYKVAACPFTILAQ